MTSEKFTQQFQVPASAIDERGHVNNLVYLQWCLDIAEAHWKSKTSEALREKYVWYVLSHNIQYRASAFEKEELRIETWVTETEGVKSKRHYRITRTTDNKTLVEAETLWCFLDAKSLRPTKIPEEILTLFV
ncbi:acyl-CoA thioesterase [Ulvibacter antarcticus]|uniref:Acyl-CoA thioester hydrolase n=1 Tax=Ulvibacter antarcticus TaxID=442714 RepID=A0A3L9ZHM5_9FLAO|nr:thioesterase family protein [Ulvibacter antarcticus]RMA66212.1 acyl-CoA thioester hydrolase [Ulvibacter antarcticus]